MSFYRRVRRKSNLEIALQWDALAPLRHHQISSGLDITFHNILVPEIFRFMGKRRYGRALDVGCGTGVLTSMLADRVDNIDGIDISSVSINIANEFNLSKKMRFIQSSVEDYSERVKSKYDLVVANMVIMDVMDLDGVVSAVENILKPGGVFIFSMTNPYFWANYYGYENENWYNYVDEIFIEGPFSISNDIMGSRVVNSTHVHRPISRYINALTNIGMRRIQISEPMPNAEIQSLYPREWKYPRYIIGRCAAGPKVRMI